MSEAAVFVTGATGIVGGAVVKHLLNRDVLVIAAVRPVTDTAVPPAGATVRQFDFDSTPAVSAATKCLDTFLHPNFFMQNLSTTYAQRIRDHSEIFVPAGRSRTAFVDARDVGRGAVSVA